VYLISGEGSDELWDEWLPTFKRAAEWNTWSDAVCLLQFAGHLQGKSRQEFLLLDPSDKSTYACAVTALSSKYFGSCSLAPQDFLHAYQGYFDWKRFSGKHMGKTVWALRNSYMLSYKRDCGTHS